MQPSFMLVMALIHSCIAMITMVVNIYVTHRRVVASSEKDARRLRASLAAELGILKTTYENNIDAVRGEKSVIISGRPAIAVYRGSLNKLGMLHEDEIPTIVAAYAFCETIEGFLAAHGRANGPSSYSMGKERGYANDLVALYHDGVERVDRALDGLSWQPARRAEPARVAASAPARRPLAHGGEAAQCA